MDSLALHSMDVILVSPVLSRFYCTKYLKIKPLVGKFVNGIFTVYWGKCLINFSKSKYKIDLKS
jgi:hypothetical protein